MALGRALAVLLVSTGACAMALVTEASAASGDQEAGRALFVDKQCVRCHRPRGEAGAGPALEELRRPQGEMELAGRLWNHVPDMAATLEQEGSAWPPISAAEMADLMKYLLADRSRDPEPDIAKGQVTLLKKDCLKCHSLRHEGGSVRPDLAEPRADYESAAAWAATMWTHAPRMATMARQRGFSYPRFSGDEMANLIGLLRSASASPTRGPAAAPR